MTTKRQFIYMYITAVFIGNTVQVPLLNTVTHVNNDFEDVSESQKRRASRRSKAQACAQANGSSISW